MSQEQTSHDYSDLSLDTFEHEIMRAFNVPASSYSSVSHSENTLKKHAKRFNDAAFQSGAAACSFNLFNVHIETEGFSPKVQIETEVLNSVLSENELSGTCWRLKVSDFGDGIAEAVAFKQNEPMGFKRKIKMDEDEFFDDIEDTNTKKRKSLSVADMDEEQLKRSIGRSKKLMRHKALMLKIDRLITFTYRMNQEDRDLAAKHLAATIRRYKTKSGKDFQYVAVFEAQKRGAMHIHLATNDFHDINLLRECWQLATKDDGNVNVKKEKNKKNKWERAAIISYMQKYMMKDCEFNQLAQKRYLSSRGIPKPKSITFFLKPTLNDTNDEFTKAILYKLVRSLTSGITKEFYQVPTEYGTVYFSKTY